MSQRESLGGEVSFTGTLSALFKDTGSRTLELFGIVAVVHLCDAVPDTQGSRSESGLRKIRPWINAGQLQALNEAIRQAKHRDFKLVLRIAMKSRVVFENHQP